MLRISESRIRAELGVPIDFPENTFNCIIQDLTFDPSMKGTSLYYQPLIPIGDGEYVVSPTLVTLNRWDESLERLWLLLHKAEYEAVVPQLKMRLSTEVADAFARLDFAAVAEKDLFVEGGRVEGDADVAVADVISRTLVMAEVKNLLIPASVFQAKDRQNRIDEGIRQAGGACRFIRDHPIDAAKRLFPDLDIDLGEDWTVVGLVVSRGFVGLPSVESPHPSSMQTN